MKQFLTLNFLVGLILILFNSCQERKLPDSSKIKFESVRTNKLQLPEPSGLDLTFDKKGFWTVSDENSTVYRLDMDGNILRSFKVKGIDLEGITIVNENTIAVVLERSREIVLLDTLGKEIKRRKLDLPGELNSGIEGITYDSVNKKFYIVNEKSPGLLIELDSELNELNRTELKLAKDYSGIFYENHEDVLWILSDESQKIMITDKSGKLIEEYNTKIVQAEGITLDYENNRCYIVSDNKEELYEYKILR
ncbi:MAG: SdiA-regulated domain-containing protein [Ignavibacteriaceae bacterium]